MGCGEWVVGGGGAGESYGLVSVGDHAESTVEWVSTKKMCDSRSQALAEDSGEVLDRRYRSPPL